jgi:hypothetical protein
MRKTALSLGLEQAFGQTQQLTYSEEGSKTCSGRSTTNGKNGFQLPTGLWKELGKA